MACFGPGVVALPPLAMTGNGGFTEKYTWTQTLKQVTVHVIPPVLDKRLLKVHWTSNQLSVRNGDVVLLEGTLYKAIRPDESTWYIVDHQLIFELEKKDGMEWWSCVLDGDPAIDASACEPENSQLSDLDPETRQMVEKMMLEQREKMSRGETS